MSEKLRAYVEFVVRFLVFRAINLDSLINYDVVLHKMIKVTRNIILSNLSKHIFVLLDTVYFKIKIFIIDIEICYGKVEMYSVVLGNYWICL